MRLCAVLHITTNHTTPELPGAREEREQAGWRVKTNPGEFGGLEEAAGKTYSRTTSRRGGSRMESRGVERGSLGGMGNTPAG